MAGECMLCGESGNWCQCEEDSEPFLCVYPAVDAGGGTATKHAMVWCSGYLIANDIAAFMTKTFGIAHKVYVGNSQCLTSLIPVFHGCFLKRDNTFASNWIKDGAPRLVELLNTFHPGVVADG